MYITRRQKDVLDFLTKFIARHGYAPTFEEIASHFNFRSKGTVYRYIQTLKEKRFIRHEWNRTRAIELAPVMEEVIPLPVLGVVAAGKPIRSGDLNEQIGIPTELLSSGGHYILKVQGESMVDEHIMDGDFVIVQEKSSAEDGQTVVAMIDQEKATIKKYRRRNGTVELIPANPSLKPLVVDVRRVTIQGIVVGVLRKY